MKLKRFMVVGLMLFFLATVVGCSQSNPPASGDSGKSSTSSSAGSNKFTLIIYDTMGNPFFKKVVTGAQETAKAYGAQVDVQYAENDPQKQNDMIQTAIANHVDGIGLAINIDNAYDDSIKKAQDAGIPVVVFNIKGATNDKNLAFVGQDFVTAGYTIAKRLVETSNIGKGAKVVCPVEHPEATYAKARFEGVKKALDEVGATGEVLDTGAVSLDDTLTKLTQYLLGHKDTNAVVALGGMPMEMAPKAIASAGLNIPNVGFDLTKGIVQNILDGKTLAAVDQQPYDQGAFTIMQLVNYKKYGLIPCDVNTGSAIIDKTNAAKVLELADTVR